MQTRVLADANELAAEAARWIADESRSAVASRGQFLIALSGGRTPWMMLRTLSMENVPWRDVHVFQVDERIAPDGDPDRNLTHIRENLLDRVPLVPEQIHAMPVQVEDLADGARDYAGTLGRIAGLPPVLDLVHLGLGPDGHTASLVPEDLVLEVEDADVALTAPYQGHRRMTLTYPMIDRARRIFWVVTGGEKAKMLSRLCIADTSIPAGRIEQANAMLLTDASAAEFLRNA